MSDVMTKGQQRIEEEPMSHRQDNKVAPAIKVPRGVFAINIDELRRQLRDSQVLVGPDGLVSSDQGQSGQGRSDASQAMQAQAGSRGQGGGMAPASISVPKGTFHSDFLDWIFGDERAEPVPNPDPIARFTASAPNAVYQGMIGDSQTWTEWVTDPVTGARVQLAYTSRDGGETAEAWCIEPNMRGHHEDMHTCHCYGDGRICTDLHGVARDLVAKRARAILWVTGFCQYLKTGEFSIDAL